MRSLCASEFTGLDYSFDCFCVPVLSRNGGVLLKIPRNVFSEEILIDSLHVAEADALLGPSKGVQTNLWLEDDRQNIVVQPTPTSSLVIDFSDVVLEMMREYDPIAEADSQITPFSDQIPSALPVPDEVLSKARAWVEQLGSERVFYSAQEDQEKSPSPKAAAKSAGVKKVATPKRVTNAQVLD